MLKKPKSIVISFRLSPLAIAKAIDGLKNYDKSADISKLSTIVKQTTLHGINYLTNALPWEASEESQRIVQVLTTQGKQENIEELILNQGTKRLLEKESSISEATSEASNQLKVGKSYLEKAVIGKPYNLSTKSSVTDFSMPKELRQEIEEK